MRIGFVHPTRLKGGGERLVAILLNGLSGKGHGIALAGLDSIGFDLAPKIQTYFTCKIFPLRTFFYIFTVLRMIFSFKPHVLFFSRIFGLSAGFVGTILSVFPISRIIYVNVRLQQCIYGTQSDGKEGKSILFKVLNYLDYFFSKFTMKHSNIVLCNSNYTKKSLSSILDKLEIVFPPIDIEKFKPIWSKKDSKLIVYISRFAPEKKQDYALRIFKQLNKNGDYRLFLIGYHSDESYFQYCKDLATNIQGAKVLGNVSENELIDFYQRASIFLFLRRTEPFGIAPIEAMACGTIPVLLRGGGVSETVIHDISGILCDNYKEIIQSINEILNNQILREKIAYGAVNRARFFRKELFVKRCETAIKRAYGQVK